MHNAARNTGTDHNPRENDTQLMPPPTVPEASTAISSAASEPSVEAPTEVSTTSGEIRGVLKVGVVPWAEVAIDNQIIGVTPLAPIELSPGHHTLRLVHPSYSALVRDVEIRSGETTILRVDLQRDGSTQQ